MAHQVTLPALNEEQAAIEIRQHLKSNKPYLSIETLISNKLQKQQTQFGVNELDSKTNTDVYYLAAWNLVNRGIVYPLPFELPPSAGARLYYGPTFELTPYGETWLDTEDEFECLPTEYGRFGGMLMRYSENFGDGYVSRSKEAIGCYQAKLYLSCCVMCGAATESILLRLAIEKTGDETSVLNKYAAKQGLAKVLNDLQHNKSGKIGETMEGIRELVQYWRDESAHGRDSDLHEFEAFMALLLLLKFASVSE